MGLSRFYKEACEAYAPWCGDWFGIGNASKDWATVFNATFYAFAYSFMTSAAFGFLYSESTGKTFGVGDSFASAGLTGLFMTFVGGQPLVLYGQTGPVVLLYSYAWLFANDQEWDFKGFVAWIGVWSALMHFALALGMVCDRIDLVTRFTAEIFELLVAADYVTAGIEGFYEQFHAEPHCDTSAGCDGHAEPTLQLANGLFNLLLGLAFFALALQCNHAVADEHGLGGIRWGISSVWRCASRFGAGIAILVITALSYAPRLTDRAEFSASYMPARVDAPGEWNNPRNDWPDAVNNMMDLPTSGIFGAIIPAFLLTVLFYVDQNLSTMAAVNGFGELRTSKPAFNLDFFLLGITVLFTGLLGLPASSGLIPQNPMHTKALCSAKIARDEAEKGQKTTGCEFVVVEQRISNFIHSGLLLIISSSAVLPICGFLPAGLLWGAFFLLATEAYHAHFPQRVLMLFTSNEMRVREAWDDMRDIIEFVPRSTMTLFTLIQFFTWSTVFVIAVILKIPFGFSDNTWVIIGSTFPVMICLCAVPIRSHILPLLFSEEHLEALDGNGVPAVEVPSVQAIGGQGGVYHRLGDRSASAASAVSIARMHSMEGFRARESSYSRIYSSDGAARAVSVASALRHPRLARLHSAERLHTERTSSYSRIFDNEPRSKSLANPESSANRDAPPAGFSMVIVEGDETEEAWTTSNGVETSV